MAAIKQQMGSGKFSTHLGFKNWKIYRFPQPIVCNNLLLVVIGSEFLIGGYDMLVGGQKKINLL